MKRLFLAVALFCSFGVGNAFADRCSEFCAKCERSQSRDISTCCKAEAFCHGKCDAVKYDCPSLGGDGDGDGGDFRNQHFPAPMNERDMRREVQEGVDRAIWNYQQNFRQPGGFQFAFGG